VDFAVDVAAEAVLAKYNLTWAGQYLLPIGIDHLKNRFIERIIARRAEVALGEPAVVAVQEGEPLARRYGLYLGPLKPEGSASLLAGIKPFA
jgi:hypothetical protein